MAWAMVVLHPAEGRAQLRIVGGVPPVEEAEGLLVGHHQLEVGGEAQLDLLAGPLGVGGGLDDAGHQLGGEHVHQLEVEGPLGLEVLVDQRLGHAGGLGDVVHGGGGVAVLGEERQGHLEELATSGVGGEAPSDRVAVARPSRAPAVGLGTQRAAMPYHGGRWEPGSRDLRPAGGASQAGRTAAILAGQVGEGEVGRRPRPRLWSNRPGSGAVQPGGQAAAPSGPGRTSRSRRRPARRPPDRGRRPADVGGPPTRWSDCRIPPRWRAGPPRRRPGRRPSTVIRPRPPGSPRTTGHRAAATRASSSSP